LFTALAAVPLSAQVSFTPTIGAYLPTSNLANVVLGTDTTGTFRQDVGLALGASLGVGLGSRFGVQMAGTYVPSQLSGTIDQTGTITQSDANLFFGNANVTFYVVKPTHMVWLALNGGGSVVSRSGPAYEGVTGTTSVGGLVGATLGFRLGSVLSFHVSATNFIYSAQFTKNDITTEQSTQNDILLGLGLGVPLGGKKMQVPTP
jgi:hypothetical protein